MKNDLENGFTLIEMIIVVAIMGIVSVIGGDILLSVFRAYNKANVLAEIRKNGDYVLNIITSEIRNSTNLTFCESGTNCITFMSSTNSKVKKIDSGIDIINCDNGFVRIYSDMAVPNQYTLLTNSGGQGVNVENFTFTITELSNVSYVTVSFMVKEPCSATNPDATRSFFSHTVEIRGY